MTHDVVAHRLRARFAKWDTHEEGVVRRVDFQREADRIVDALGRERDSAQAHELSQALCGLFDFVALGAPGSTLTAARFHAVCENLIFKQGEAAFNRALTPLVRGLIGLCEDSRGGTMNRAEFVAWLSVLGLDGADAERAFDRIDTTQTGRLALPELLRALRDYHFGTLDIELIPY